MYLSLYLFILHLRERFFLVAGILERYGFEIFGFVLIILDDYISIRKSAAFASDMGNHP